MQHRVVARPPPADAHPPSPAQAKTLGQLLHDPFANYVVQTLLTVGEEEEVRGLLEKLQPHLKTLRSTLYGKRIHAKLVRRFPHIR